MSDFASEFIEMTLRSTPRTEQEKSARKFLAVIAGVALCPVCDRPNCANRLHRLSDTGGTK